MKPSPYFDGSTGRKYGYGPGSRTVIEFEAPRNGSHGTEQPVYAGPVTGRLRNQRVVVGGIVSDAAKLRGCACIGKYPGAGREETIRIDPSSGEFIGQ
jgi:hypothetical protein